MQQKHLTWQYFFQPNRFKNNFDILSTWRNSLSLTVFQPVKSILNSVCNLATSNVLLKYIVYCVLYDNMQSLTQICFIRSIILLFTAVSRHLTNPRVYLKSLVLGRIVILVSLVANVVSPASHWPPLLCMQKHDSTWRKLCSHNRVVVCPC